MLDAVSLDQLSTFIAAADEGSFSAAGRRLRRAQSVVSQTLANLEGQFGVKLFDRSARLPALHRGAAGRGSAGARAALPAEHLQLVHTDRPDLPPGREFVHLSPRRW